MAPSIPVDECSSYTATVPGSVVGPYSLFIHFFFVPREQLFLVNAGATTVGVPRTVPEPSIPLCIQHIKSTLSIIEQPVNEVLMTAK